MAEVGKTGPGNEADIAGADHGNAHQNCSLISMRCHRRVCIGWFPMRGQAALLNFASLNRFFGSRPKFP